MALKHIFGDVPVIKILDYMIDNQLEDHTASDIAEGAEIGPTAMKRNFKCLTQCGIVFMTRTVGGVPLYALDMENEMTQSLIEFDEELTDYCTDMILDAEENIDDMQEAEDARDRFMAGPDYATGPEPED